MNAGNSLIGLFLNPNRVNSSKSNEVSTNQLSTINNAIKYNVNAKIVVLFRLIVSISFESFITERNNNKVKFQTSFLLKKMISDYEMRISAVLKKITA